jgi:hypothetical protein
MRKRRGCRCPPALPRRTAVPLGRDTPALHPEWSPALRRSKPQSGDVVDDPGGAEHGQNHGRDGEQHGEQQEGRGR